MTVVGSWGYYLQGSSRQRDLDRMGSELSVRLDCPVHYPAFGKNIFECRCGVLFPAFVVGGALSSGDWSAVLKQHAEGYKPQDIAF